MTQSPTAAPAFVPAVGMVETRFDLDDELGLATAIHVYIQ